MFAQRLSKMQRFKHVGRSSVFGIHKALIDKKTGKRVGGNISDVLAKILSVIKPLFSKMMDMGIPQKVANVAIPAVNKFMDESLGQDSKRNKVLANTIKSVAVKADDEAKKLAKKYMGTGYKAGAGLNMF